jgi:FAD/FMN-containing dehydrogenase
VTGLGEELAQVVGKTHVLVDPDMTVGFTRDWTGRWHGDAALVARPGTTDEVATVVRVCQARRVVIVPQGGNTGLVGGGVPGEDTKAPVVVVSLGRLTEKEPVDPLAGQVTVGAGVTLADVHAHVDHSGTGLAFAVDMASRDSATVGGMVATNAGGLRVVRYGGTRSQVAGVEAVLADGSVISRLDGLVKDNTGYDLSQLLIGSEGTLAIVTRARLKLVPSLPVRCTALLGLAGTAQVVDVVARLRRDAPGLEAAEVFYPEGLALVQQHAGLPSPLRRGWGAYLLLECAGRDDSVLDELASVADGLGADAAAVALDAPSRRRLWAYRERHTEMVNSLGVPHKLDVTLPLTQLARFETDVRQLVAAVAPDATLILWGHVGDGNLHVNVVGPPPNDETVDDAVLRLVAGLGGSISAEHGVGRAKRAWLSLTRSPTEIAVMSAVKRALDPHGTLNPGVLLPA